MGTSRSVKQTTSANRAKMKKYGPEQTDMPALSRGRVHHSIIELALDCIIIINHKGKIIEFNPAAEKTFGYRKKEVLGKSSAEVIIPSHMREQHHRGMEHYLKTGEGPILGKRLELTAVNAAGEEFPVELAVTAFKDPNQDQPIFISYLRDISERILREEELQLQKTLLECQSEASVDGILFVSNQRE